jgi:hemolysin-activating ACP:hemolysin acyltransferase
MDTSPVIYKQQYQQISMLGFTIIMILASYKFVKVLILQKFQNILPSMNQLKI